jgi:hypothetical protein
VVKVQIGDMLTAGREITRAGYWGWGPKEQMSEFPIPHGELYEPCPLRRYRVS